MSQSLDRTLLTGVLLFVAASAVGQDTRPESLAFFENNVRPLLIDRCVKCHGPMKAESGLRLDAMSSVLRGGDTGLAVVPRQPEQSLIVQAVRHIDGLEMPPDEKLSDTEIAAIERWINEGAPWPEGMTLAEGVPGLRSGPITDDERTFWSFQPIDDPPPPQIDASLTVHNDVDRFVQARLSDADLVMRTPAEKRVLIRRMTFDLTGLPPTPEEVDAFVADDSPDAVMRVVDRLLATQAYGERWGRHWLDVVRYADTAGETADYPAPLAWKYRNWVIDAFNSDKPYDEFVREQIAGDILADQFVADATQPYDNQMLAHYENLLKATGFIATSRRFGFDVENYHHLTIQDTIDTIGQGVLGLSLGCARCHDHKYDPVNTADYYAWYGILKSTRYSFPGSEEKKRPYDLIPAVPPPVAVDRKAQFDAREAELETEFSRLGAEKKAIEEKLCVAEGGWKAYVEARRLTHSVADSDGHKGYHVWSENPLPLVGINTSDATLQVPGTVAPRQLVVHPNPIEGIGIGWRSPIAGRVQMNGKVKDAHDCGDGIAWYLDHLDTDELHKIVSGVIDRNTEQSFAEPNGPVEIEVQQGDIIQLAVMPKADHGCDLTQVVFTLTEVEGDRRKWDLVSDVLHAPRKKHPLDDQYGNPDVWSFFVVSEDRGIAVGETLLTELTATERVKLESDVDHLSKELMQLTAAQEALKAAQPYEVIFGATEQDEPEDAAVQIRGDPLKPGETVPRKNLEILGSELLPSNSGSGRLQMAEWLTRESNPLTARVMVNRIWQQHFGRGLVATENDFGARGERPSHPQLLDWLASRFVESGWSVNAMHRLMMASATYQQSSAFDAVAVEADPESRLLWRFNRRRLSAEEIRDAMLFVSGDLDPASGSGHPFPEVETWGFTQHSPYYGVYATNRRSIYLMQQRLKRHPFLGLFDGADPNASTARRALTTVPTQALYLMNNEFVHDRAASLARRAMASADDPTQQISAAYLLALGRRPDDDELTESLSFLKEYAGSLDSTVPDHEPLAWNALARMILTRNEFLFVD